MGPREGDQEMKKSSENIKNDFEESDLVSEIVLHKNYLDPLKYDVAVFKRFNTAH